MNSRIQELLLKAGWDRYEALDERNQKFAELIVQECDRVIKDSVSAMEHGKMKANIAHAGTLIKQHFGVE